MQKAGSVFLGLCLLGLPLGATAQDNFYASNDLNIVVGSSPGGTQDTYARILGRYLGKHIPGNPNVIVQNMPGAGGMTAVRHLNTIAQRDGSVIVTFNPGIIVGGLVDSQNVPFVADEYNFVGSISRSLRVCYTLAHSGIADWDDLVARDEFIMGTTAPGTGAYIDAAVLKNVFDIAVRPITGFPGSSDINVALERGEVDGYCSLWSSVPENWKGSDEFVPLVRMADITDPYLPETVPFVGDLAETDEQRAILDVIAAGYVIGSPYIVSSQVPEERLAILREAFDATMADPEFLAEAERLAHPVDPLPGVDAEEIVDGLYSAEPEFIDQVRAAMEM